MSMRGRERERGRARAGCPTGLCVCGPRVDSAQQGGHRVGGLVLHIDEEGGSWAAARGEDRPSLGRDSGGR